MTLQKKLEAISEEYYSPWMSVLRIATGLFIWIKGYLFIVDSSGLIDILKNYFGTGSAVLAMTIAGLHLITGFFIIAGFTDSELFASTVTAEVEDIFGEKEITEGTEITLEPEGMVALTITPEVEILFCFNSILFTGISPFVFETFLLVATGSNTAVRIIPVKMITPINTPITLRLLCATRAASRSRPADTRYHTRERGSVRKPPNFSRKALSMLLSEDCCCILYFILLHHHLLQNVSRSC